MIANPQLTSQGGTTMSCQLPSPAIETAETSSADEQPARKRLFDRILLGVVAVTAACLAVWLLAQFAESPRQRWHGVDCDRNFHYLTALRLGIDLRSGDLVAFGRHLSKIRTWPPLHPLVIGTAVAISGPDFRWAVIPNLIAWAGTVVLTFLVARRCVTKFPNLAGLAAVTFVLSSPAHRVFATDFMFEAMGAFFSMLALYCYLRAKQQWTSANVRWLGLSLTLLFFLKYNYWFLISIALIGAELWSSRIAIAAYLRTVTGDGTLSGWWKRQTRRPANYIFLGLFAVSVAVLLHGNVRFTILGQDMDISGKAYRLWFATYVAFLARTYFAWREEGEWIWDRIGSEGRRFVWWHLVPIGIWFLVPKRLGYFIWYISPVNGVNSEGGILAGAKFYAHHLSTDYHVSAGLALAALVLAVIGMLFSGRLRSGGIAVVLFLCLSALATFEHGNRKSRMAHSWVAAGWVLAGVGVAGVVAFVPRKRLRAAPVLVGGTAVAGLAILQAPAWLDHGHSPESGHFAAGTCLEVADVYLPWVKNDENVAILGTLPFQSFSEWTFLERFPDKNAPECRVRKFSASYASNLERFQQWLEKTDADSVVLVDIEDDSEFYFGGFDHYRQLLDLLERQNVFRPVQQKILSEKGCVVTRWVRNEAPEINAQLATGETSTRR
ncbi:hypothetical protein Pan216_33090 [Planctomycetes bacterium Pan216]|uniref:Uncharacterized protein n=1 Tax=Kolteria novifilia TaxID=2527975 RepID=A0A518B684_9BACT|nr:hypothetical protein Pan216_33090 [Planctomycetes bacterium Pan216]